MATGADRRAQQQQLRPGGGHSTTKTQPLRRRDPPLPARLAAEVSGQGPPVLCLHGQPGSRADWSAVAADLRADCSVIAVDRPGYGRTEAGAVGFGANAGAAAATLDRLGVDRAVVVGHSWGGGVALAAALDYAERVAGLVLVSSVGPGNAPHLLDRLLAAPVIGEVLAVSTFAAAGTLLASGSVRSGLDRMANVAEVQVANVAGKRAAKAARRRILPGAARAALAAVAGGRGPDADHHRPWVWGRDAQWRSFTVEQRAFVAELDDLEAGLAALRVPCVVVVGTHDHIVDPAVAERLAASIPKAELRRIAGAGHLLPFDHPRHVADAVRAVLVRSGLSARQDQAGAPDRERRPDCERN